MRKLIILSILALLVSSCGVGTYSHSSGQADYGYICITADEAYEVSLIIDNKEQVVQTVKTIAHRSGRNIKATAKNSVVVSSGQHTIEIFKGDQLLLSKKVIISINETKIIKL